MLTCSFWELLPKISSTEWVLFLDWEEKITKVLHALTNFHLDCICWLSATCQMTHTMINKAFACTQEPSVFCWRTGTEEQLDIVGERSNRDWTVLTSPVSWCGKMEELKRWPRAFLRERLLREDKASQNWRIRTWQRKNASHRGI